MPDVTLGAMRTYPEGVTSWIELASENSADTTEFYGELFGWTFAEASPQYLIAQLDGLDAAGISVAAANPSQWHTFVAVDDAQRVADRVAAAGGTVLVAPEPAGEDGIWAGCADPTGAEFRLLQATRRPGAQVANIPGAWNFTELRSPDPVRAQAFYTDVFGWAFDDLGFATMIRRPGYGDHLAATVDPGIHERQSGDGVPPGFADAFGWVAPLGPGERPHWHVTFTVADRDAAAHTVARLGGTVLSVSDSDWTRDAVIRDRLGAVCTLSQYTPPDPG